MRVLRSLRSRSNSVVVTNAGSIVGTQAVTSALGFVYWWLAARQFSPEAVGLASAAISAMLLLGNLGMMGFGTLLIGELPRQSGSKRALITTAFVVAGTAGTGLGLLFALAAPWFAKDLRALAEHWHSAGLFALGVGLTSAAFVLDQAVIGLLRGELQLWRNGLQAAAKLGFLTLIGLGAAEKSGLTIYATWVIGAMISLAALPAYAARKGRHLGALRPHWRWLRKLGRATLGHHALNLALQAPGLILPIVVTAVLSARINAYFYAAWMIASFVFIIPASLATVLYALGAAEPAELPQKVRLTLKLSLGIGVPACLGLWIGADWVLGLFKAAYVEQAGWCLRILGLGIFPLIVRNHYVVIRRVHSRVTSTAPLMAVGGLLELILAGIGASLAGLTGLSIGWLVAMCVEAVFMAPTVYRIATSSKSLARIHLRSTQRALEPDKT